MEQSKNFFKIYPALIAESVAAKILSVQPMSAPTDTIFYIQPFSTVFKSGINPIENKLQTVGRLYLEQITDYHRLNGNFHFYIE